MTERNLSRRSLLRAGASGLAALPVVAAVLPHEAKASAAPISAEHAALIKRIRALKVKLDRLVRIELDSEIQNGEYRNRNWRRASYVARRADEELDRLTVECLRRPVTCWGDVAVIGELAIAHAERSLQGGFALIDDNEPLIAEPASCDLREYTLGALMLAARTVGGAHV